MAEWDHPLQEFVNRPDPHFSVDGSALVTTGDGYKMHTLGFTSQKWLTKSEVDHPLWRHSLRLTVPDERKSDQVLLFITGGGRSSQPPGDPNPLAVYFALETGAVVVELTMVPNQPLLFTGASAPKVEDAIIAHSWNEFLETGDTDWIAQFPMTKSAVAAMTVAENYCRREFGFSPSGFVVTGASKRGWTTWLTAAVDDRVVGIAPLVIDVLNMIPSMQHHRRVYGFWAEAIQDYVDHGITDRINDPVMEDLADMVDPWRLRHRIKVPKFIINAANDEFFLPDSSQFYFDDLPGTKYLRYVPNSGHGLNNPDVVNSIVSFFRTVDGKERLPSMTWRSPGEDRVIVKTGDAVRRITLWEAVNPETRDFRMSQSPPPYEPTRLAVRPDGTYDIRVARPEKGWKAWLVEVEFELGSQLPVTETTPIYVVGAAD